MILENNYRKKVIDLSDELASYYSPVRKSLTWHRKTWHNVLFMVRLVNAVFLYFKLKPHRKCVFLNAQTDIVKKLLAANIIEFTVSFFLFQFL